MLDNPIDSDVIDEECGLDEPSRTPPSAKPFVAGYRLNVIDDLSKFAPKWAEFELASVGSLFQSLRWVSTWLRTAAAACGETPLIIAGYDRAGQLAFIFPFATRINGSGKTPASTLTWLGQSQTSYNIGIYRRDVMNALTADQLDAILKSIIGLRPDIVAANFTNQPLAWEGVANPFANLHQFPARGNSFELELQSDFEALYEAKFSTRSRSTLRRKQRQLAKQGKLTIQAAASDENRLKIYEIFTKQKAVQFAEQGIENFLDDPVTARFYRELAGPCETLPIFEQSHIDIDEDVAATLNGFRFKDRFYFIQTSMALGRLAKWSPGLLLLRDNIAWNCDRGVTHFDLGPGTGAHKEAWHGNEIELFDTYFAARASGYPATMKRIVMARAIKFAKSNQRIASAARWGRTIVRSMRAAIWRQ